MKDKDLKKLLQNKLKKPLTNIQIFEEGIDLETQIEFEKKAKKILEEKKSDIDFPKFEEKLFSEQTGTDEKKDILITLCFNDDVKAYRIIERFKETCDDNLKKWTTLSLQKSRAHIEHALSNNEKIYISSGLGGSGDKLRYFFVLSASDNINFTTFHQEILKKEIDFVLEKYDGISESVNYYDYFVTIVCLIPIHVSLDKVFKTILDECNEFGNFLSDKIIATNAEEFDKDTIEKLLNEDLPGLSELENNEGLSINFSDDDDDYDDFDDDDDDYDDDEYDDDDDYEDDDEYDDDDFDDDDDIF